MKEKRRESVLRIYSVDLLTVDTGKGFCPFIRSIPRESGRRDRWTHPQTQDACFLGVPWSFAERAEGHISLDVGRA